LAAEKPVGGLVLEAPSSSAAGAQHYWFVAVRLFMKDQFRSDLRAGKVTAPVLVVHGENDTVVPITLGERLYGLIQAPAQIKPRGRPLTAMFGAEISNCIVRGMGHDLRC
jgi:pimeloyl-ACP methyl ester carboxylesterase